MDASDAALNSLKEIPGFKAIMRTVLKFQMQYLVEQMSKHVGEETIILTASVCDGSLSHHGSDTAKNFLQGREELKSQFLGYCLKNHHKRLESEEATKQDNTHEGAMYQNERKRKFNGNTGSNSPILPTPDSQRLLANQTIQSRYDKKHKVIGSQELQSDVNVTSGSISASPPSTADESEMSTYSSTSVPQQWPDAGTDTESQAFEIHPEASNSFSHVNIKAEPTDEMHLDLEPKATTGNTYSPGWIGTEHTGTGYNPSNRQDNYTIEEKSFLENSAQAITQHQCTKCGKYFKSLQNLQVHDRQHTGLRPFSCSLCGKKFFQKSHLKSHLRMHTGEQPHTCDVCGDSFCQKSTLINHKISKHFAGHSMC